jgi:predicted RNase H-like HicB family nuclease
MNNKYEIIMYWSESDNLMISEIPELPGCIAHGNNEFESLQNLLDAKKLWIDTALEFGDNIPEPKGRLIFA